MFKERDRDRCNSCGRWVQSCSLATPSIELQNYGKYAICENCFKEHSYDDLKYWKNWIEKRESKSK